VYSFVLGGEENLYIFKKRSSGELASYQKKLIKIDDHMGVGIAGLTSDARVLR
jgi:20S proteasome alpha/beta subunit